MRTHLVMPSLDCLLLVACSGSSTQGTSSSTAPLSGPVELRVADFDDDALGVLPPVDTVTHVVVTISRIDARLEDARPDDEEDVWTTVSSQEMTVDLLTLQGGAFASVGVTELPAGSAEALRLFIDPSGTNTATTADGAVHPLTVPSDVVRIAGHFQGARGATGQVTLAFAGRKSRLVVDTTGTWMLRPVIRLSRGRGERDLPGW